jgi:hypothetical protein
MSLCQYCVEAMVFPAEEGKCCGYGKHILGPKQNPPIAEDYRTLIVNPLSGKYSRFINQSCVFGSIGTAPSRAQGGEGFSQRPGVSMVALKYEG